MELSRQHTSSLAAGTVDDQSDVIQTLTFATGTPIMTLSSRLQLDVSAFDTVKVEWAMNPFASLPRSHQLSTSVLEFTLRDVSTGEDLDLSTRSDPESPGSPPVDFWYQVNTGELAISPVRLIYLSNTLTCIPIATHQMIAAHW
jgi:hypothetical protein